MTPTDIIGLIIAGAILVIATIGCINQYYHEKYVWNDGICRENGLPWKLFDMDSQGGRGYKAGLVCMWIGWRSIDKNYKEPQEIQ